jgi:hypothetical protein
MNIIGDQVAGAVGNGAMTLEEFLATTANLTLEERRQIVDQAQAML